MAANVGSTDRVIRLIIGIVLLVLAFTVVNGSVWEWIFIGVGALAIFTALTRFCALYPLFKINTTKKK